MHITNTDSPIKIIIAEDNKLYKNAIIGFLQDDPIFKIIGDVKDGKTAVAMAKELRPDVVIMDLGLPVMSGLEATIKIKETNPSIKVIVLTSHINQEESFEVLAAGATAYVNKDIDMDYMKMIIETINQGAIWLSPHIGQKIISDGLKNYKRA